MDNQVEVLKRELEATKRQLEYERKEKEYWMGKYLKLKQRYTTAFPSVRSRRNSRDEEEHKTRPAPAPASTQRSNAGHREILTIDVSSPASHREQPRTLQEPVDISDEDYPQPSWRRPSRLPSTLMPGSSTRNSELRTRTSPGTLELERIASVPRRTPIFEDTEAHVESAMNSLNNARRRRNFGLTTSTLSTRSLAGTTAEVPAPRAAAPSDPDEEASLALALALQEEEVQEARRVQAIIEEARESSRRAAAFAEMNRLQSALDRRFNDNNAFNHASRSMFINPDSMSHDELVRLGEQMGDVKKERWRERAIHVISRLPSHRLQSPPRGDSHMCIVCQEDFKAKDHVLTLPCAHIFHYDCVEGWIRENNSCPTCKLPIDPED